MKKRQKDWRSFMLELIHSDLRVQRVQRKMDDVGARYGGWASMRREHETQYEPLRKEYLDLLDTLHKSLVALVKERAEIDDDETFGKRIAEVLQLKILPDGTIAGPESRRRQDPRYLKLACAFIAEHERARAETRESVEDVFGDVLDRYEDGSQVYDAVLHALVYWRKHG